MTRVLASYVVHLPTLAFATLLTASVGAAPPAAGSDPRVERVLKGLRPRAEVEGAPLRWALAERMAAHKVPAVTIAIVDGGKIVWAQAFGVKELGGQDPATATTLFQAASISKAVSVSAALRLVDKGKLSLDADVNRYLTSWKLPANDLTRQVPVTLRQLASHTAGTTIKGFRGYPVGAPVPTLLEVLDGKPPANTEAVRVDKLPGEGFSYSGGGTTIIQQLLIDVAGMPFPTLLQQQVFAPLGMAHSTFEQPLPAARAQDAARASENGTAVPGGWHLYPEMAPAGLWTTATDLAKWGIAIVDAINGRSSSFLTKATAEQIVASQVCCRVPGERAGLGLFVAGTGDSLRLGHSGSNKGFQADFKMFVKTGQGAAIMINAGENSYDLVWEIQFAIAAEFGWPLTEATRITAVSVDPETLEGLTGTYKFSHKSPRVVREGGRLFLEGWDFAREELFPQSASTFIGTTGTRFSFARDADGRGVLTRGVGARASSGPRQ